MPSRLNIPILDQNLTGHQPISWWGIFNQLESLHFLQSHFHVFTDGDACLHYQKSLAMAKCAGFLESKMAQHLHPSIFYHYKWNPNKKQLSNESHCHSSMFTQVSEKMFCSFRLILRITLTTRNLGFYTVKKKKIQTDVFSII